MWKILLIVWLIYALAYNYSLIRKAPRSKKATPPTRGWGNRTRVLVVGATGGTGRELVKQALVLGHQVTAFVRQSKRLKIEHANLRVVTGNVFFLATIMALLAAQTENVSAQQPQPPAGGMSIPTWKDLIAKNYVPYHHLTAADFHIDDHEHPEAAYFVRPFIQPFYHFVWTQGAGGYVYAHIADWTIYSGLDRNETSRKTKLGDITPYLPFAQAFLDLNELHARKLAALTPGELPSGEGETVEKAVAQLDDRLIAFCRTKLNDGEKEARKLGDSTDNGRNQKKVRTMAAAIKKRLAEIPRPASMPDPSSTPVPALSPIATPAASAAASPARPK